MIVENLNLENFWNDLRQQCPEAVFHFSQWIDEYKKDNDWEELFGKELTFHDLPFEMQNGIIARYELELFNNQHGKGKEVYLSVANSYKNSVRKLFNDLQLQIARRKAKQN